MKKQVEQLLLQTLEHLKNSGVITTLPELEVSIPDSRFGDYASNAALQLARAEKKNPKELAEIIAAELENLNTQGLFSAIAVAGGFINFTLSKAALLKNLQNVVEQADLYGSSIRGGGQPVVVEYFQNNVAKPPHVGHLRSAVIGDALVRILKSQGYKVISDTHIGDWGVQFGILIYAFKTNGDRRVVEKDPINELNKLYVAMSAEIEKDPSLREKGKEEFIKLEKGDTENRELWQWFVRVSLEDFERYSKLLQILPFDHNLGESFYEEHMPAVLEEFKSKHLVQTGETGEQYVDLEAQGLGRCILVKSDGGTTYHLRDFATYIYRRKEFHFLKNIYVVDNRQSHHFKQLFKVLELAGYPTTEDSLHAELGFMSLPEGAISTRKGTTISLQHLIEEANKRAQAIINEKNPGLENKQAVAELVALAAIKYFDLSHNRNTEIVFTWDKALSFEGNTGPYLQYTHARIQGILRKSGSEVVRPFMDQEADESARYNPSELDLLRKLVKFPEILEQVATDYLPNLLCNYLFELSQVLNQFYETSPVIQESNEEVKQFRLHLIAATAQVLKNGLYLLGIEAPEEM